MFSIAITQSYLDWFCNNTNVKNYRIILDGGITLGVILVVTKSLFQSILKLCFACYLDNVYLNTKPSRIAFTTKLLTLQSSVFYNKHWKLSRLILYRECKKQLHNTWWRNHMMEESPSELSINQSISKVKFNTYHSLLWFVNISFCHLRHLTGAAVKPKEKIYSKKWKRTK